MAPPAADIATAEWLQRLATLLGGIQLGEQFELWHRIPVAIESQLGEDGKVQFASGTELRVAVRRLDAGGSTTRFTVTLDPEPDGFLTLTSGLGRLLAAPRLDKLIATLSLTSAAGRSGALPTLKIEKLALAWRPENWRQSATQRLGGTSRVEQTVSSTLDNAARELNDLATRVSAIIIGQVSGPELVRVAESANRGLRRAAAGSTTQGLNDLLLALGLGESALEPATACAAADWLSGFREFRCTVWLAQPLSETVPGDSRGATIELVTPLAIELVVRYDAGRRAVSFAFGENNGAVRPSELRQTSHGPPGLYVRAEGHRVRLARLVFEHPLSGIGSGRFTEVELRLVGGAAAGFLGAVEGLLRVAHPAASTDGLERGLVEPASREILSRLNQDVPRVTAVIAPLLEQAATQLPPQAQEWLATARGAFADNGTCPPRTTVVASAR